MPETGATTTPVQPDTSSAPPRGKHLGLALFVIAAAQLVIVLDATITNIALPAIQSDLGVSDANLAWIVNAYALAFGGLLLLGGKAGDLFGRRRMFQSGITVFTPALLLGALAPSEGLLITARILQGAGAAWAALSALALITTTFPAGQARNKAMGTYAAVSGLGATVGLLLGGVLTDALNWRWVFFVNIPIGLAVLAGTKTLIEAERHDCAGDQLPVQRVPLWVPYGAAEAGHAAVGANQTPRCAALRRDRGRHTSALC